MSRHRETLHRDAIRGGLLARLARRPSAEAYALRGGVRIAQLLPERSRRVGDVDLVRPGGALEDVERELRAALRDDTLGDGVRFHPTRWRIDRFHPASRHAGLRLIAAGEAGGRRDRLVVDVVLGLELWPVPEWTRVAGVRLRAATRATILGTKLKVLAELGPGRWRAKDLADALCLARHAPPATGELGEAIERAWAQGSPRCASAGALLASDGWWRGAEAERGWASLRASHQDLPRLDGAVRELRHRLVRATGTR
ncbi:MAG: nucleotidyl transferase AbiEii/AbiGii toxin family protein [Sandaracinaceae bacterium]